MSQDIRRHGLVVVLASVMCATASAGVPVRVVAVSGEEAVGTVGGLMYKDIYGSPIDGLGRVSFFASLKEPNANEASQAGVFSEGNGFLYLWAQSGWDAPGTEVQFSGLNTPVMSRDGKIAFDSYLKGTGVNDSNDRGIWSNTSGTLQLVAREGDAAPGAPAGAKFRILQSPLMNAMNQLAFVGILTDVGAQPPAKIGIWSTRSGSLSPVFVCGSQAPGLPAGVVIDDLGTPAMNDNGQTVFAGLLKGTGVTDANRVALYSEGGGSLAPVARSGSQAPGTLLGVNFKSFYSFSVINNAGRVTFMGSLAGLGVTEGSNDVGIWSNASGNLSLIARSGSAAPNTPIGVVFNGFSPDSVVMNGAGRVAFIGYLRGSGVTEAVNDTGIWSQGGGNLTLVARAGSQVPGMANGVVFDTFFSMAMNSAGRVAFQAQIKGPGITYQQNSDGIWAQTNAGLTLIARGGESVNIGQGDSRTIQVPFLIGGSGGEDGRNTGFNGDGNVGYAAVFTDGSNGVMSTKVDLPDQTCGTCGVGASAAMGMTAISLFATKQTRRRRRSWPGA